MSSLRATDAYPPRRTQRIVPVETIAMQRRRAMQPTVPAWCEAVERVLHVVARFGLGPIPAVVAVSSIAFSVAVARA